MQAHNLLPPITKGLAFKSMTRLDKVALALLIVIPLLALDHLPSLHMSGDSLYWVLIWLLVWSLSIALHEGLHGLMFWFFVGRVQFGVIWKSALGPMPYATAKNCLLTKREMQVVALAPQLMTLGLAFSTFWVTGDFGIILATMALANISGGAMDIFGVMWLQPMDDNIMIQDTLTGLDIYEGGTYVQENLRCSRGVRAARRTSGLQATN